MTCVSCERRISGALLKKEGVLEAVADYPGETVKIVYDENKIDITGIKKAIEEAGYEFVCEVKSDKIKSPGFSPFGIAFIIIGFLIILLAYFAYGETLGGLALEGNIEVPVLFLFGLITGVHCIGMCGGFVITYSSKNKNGTNWLLHIKYGAGKLLSNVLLGGFFGLLGSVVSFTTETRSAIGLMAGIFLVIYGLNLLRISNSQEDTPAIFFKYGHNQKQRTFFDRFCEWVFPCMRPPVCNVHICSWNRESYDRRHFTIRFWGDSSGHDALRVWFEQHDKASAWNNEIFRDFCDNSRLNNDQ